MVDRGRSVSASDSAYRRSFANFVSGLIILFERPGPRRRYRNRRRCDRRRLADSYACDDHYELGSQGIRRSEQGIRDRPIVELDAQRQRPTASLLKSESPTVPIRNGRTAAVTAEIAVRSHPLVLADPEPLVTFEAFGDSALTFVLRCYLARPLERRLETDQRSAHGDRSALP